MKFYKLLILLVISVGLGYSPGAFAQSSIDIATLLQNIVTQLGPYERLVTGAAYLLGLMMIFRALFYLKVYGEQRTMMSNQASAKVPVTLMVTGTMMVYLPTAIKIFLSTTFGSESILSYQDWTGATSAGGMTMNAIVRIIQFVGLVAFIRGVYIMSQAATGQSQGASFGKGLTHMIGGIGALNIVQTANILSATLGVNFNLNL